MGVKWIGWWKRCDYEYDRLGGNYVRCFNNMCEWIDVGYWDKVVVFGRKSNFLELNFFVVGLL